MESHGIYTLSTYIKRSFGEKIYKLALDGGMSCPNRDGTLSDKGCIFCLGGSGAFAERCCGSISEQIERAKRQVAGKSCSDRYIAYFQSYTNTYAPTEYLEKLFFEVIEREDIAALSIGTRPDCLGAEVIALIKRLCKIKPIWVELGLQTSNDRTAELINRCYPTSVYDRAVSELKATGAHIVTHVILGLPGETREDMFRTVEHAVNAGTDGIKLQLLHILRGTPLAQMYERGELFPMQEEEYCELAAALLKTLPPNVVVHRVTGDGSRADLIAPLWSLNKKRVLNMIRKKLSQMK